jgi:hypothetical protein
MYYVSGVNLKAKQQNPEATESINLGRRDDTATDDIESDNNDVFNGLMPTKF